MLFVMSELANIMHQYNARIVWIRCRSHEFHHFHWPATTLLHSHDLTLLKNASRLSPPLLLCPCFSINARPP
jgi:hypothetical protein